MILLLLIRGDYSNKDRIPCLSVDIKKHAYMQLIKQLVCQYIGMKWIPWQIWMITKKG